MSEMRNNIEALLETGISAYRVAKDAVLPENTVGRLFRGETPLDNIRFSLAEALSDYYEKLASEMITFVIDYGYNNVIETKAIDLAHAKRIAAENCSHEQDAIVIIKDGVEVARSRWYGVVPDDHDKETAVAFWGDGFYGPWWDL